MRPTSGLRLALAVLVPLIAGCAAWAVSRQLAAAAVVSLLAPPLTWLAWIAVMLIAIPPAMDSELRSRLVPLPRAASPLFLVKDCSWEPLPGPPEMLQAYAVIEYAQDLKGAQLNVWGYENGMPHVLIERQPDVAEPKGQSYRISLVTVAARDRTFPNKWGVFQTSFKNNEPNLVVIEMIMGHLRQEYRIQVMAMLTGSQCMLSVIAPEWNPYFWPEQRPAS
jgi:hypothetical protein